MQQFSCVGLSDGEYVICAPAQIHSTHLCWSIQLWNQNEIWSTWLAKQKRPSQIWWTAADHRNCSLPFQYNDHRVLCTSVCLPLLRVLFRRRVVCAIPMNNGCVCMHDIDATSQLFARLGRTICSTFGRLCGSSVVFVLSLCFLLFVLCIFVFFYSSLSIVGRCFVLLFFLYSCLAEKTVYGFFSIESLLKTNFSLFKSHGFPSVNRVVSNHFISLDAFDYFISGWFWTCLFSIVSLRVLCVPEQGKLEKWRNKTDSSTDNVLMLADKYETIKCTSWNHIDAFRVCNVASPSGNRCP